MYCSSCGREIPQGAKYCPGCGAFMADQRGTGGVKFGQAGRYASRIVPKSLLLKFPNVSPIVFVAGYVFSAVLALAVIAGLAKGRHDLSGTYYTSEFFPVTSIVFQEDGTFTAYNEYEVLQGKYTKRGSRYSLQFADGKSKSGNPVSNFEASSAGSQYALEAELIGDRQLRVYVIPKISYWAWSGKYADFYSY